MSFNINNRRYTGCKNKLCGWIENIITKECSNSNSFCDIFAGTGVVTASLIERFDTYIINDFLYSNEVCYKAFFKNCNYSEKKMYEYYGKYSALNGDRITSNYVSENYGGKFFSIEDAKKIGFIRQDIENNKKKLNVKEYSILLASLLYSADRCANTCGHYDAYIKGKKIKSNFKFELVKPITFNEKDKRRVFIYREDANKLAKKIKSDIVYMDPPYSSRQYSRFYHVLETLTKWDKPTLYGTALKPKEENMSEYCKSHAIDNFKDLVYSLNCKYIVLSYNNTYDSKSKSSKNKMELNEILNVLNAVGKTKKYEKSYKAFSAGKTDMRNHKEYIFVTKISKGKKK